MKKLITAILISSAFHGFSQTQSGEAPSDQITRLNSTIVSLEGETKMLKDSLKAVSDQNVYFRQTLNVLESKLQTATLNDLDFRLMSCKSQSGNNSVILEFLIVNRGVDKTVQFTPNNFASIVDLQGNAYKTSDIKIGTEKYASTVFKDVPLKLTITVSGIDKSVKLLKLVNLQFFTPPISYKKQAVTFRDISIQ
jgi:hypothetical protein